MKHSIFYYESLRLLRQKTFWWISALTLCFAFWVLQHLLNEYQQEAVWGLEQGLQVFGISRDVIRPFWGWMLLWFTLLTPLLSIYSFALELHDGSFSFWQQQRCSVWRLFIAKSSVCTTFISFILFWVGALVLSLHLITPIDLGLTLSGLLTVWICSFFILNISLFFSLLIGHPLMSLIASFSAVLILAFLPWLSSWMHFSSTLQEWALLTHAYGLMHGRLYINDLVFFIGGSMLLIFLSTFRLSLLLRKET